MNYNLELHKKVNGEWSHFETIIWSASYPLCKGMKIQRETTKAYFEFYKIVPTKIIRQWKLENGWRFLF